MTNIEFKEKLNEAFKSHTLMKNRKYHTINELLYVLEHDDRFNKIDFNVSIAKLDNSWWSIPTLDAFVTTQTRGVWFNDDEVEFVIDEFPYEDKILKAYCITVYEREEE